MTTTWTRTIMAAGMVAISGALCYGTPFIGASEDFNGGPNGWTYDNGGNGLVQFNGVGGTAQLTFPDSGLPTAN